MRVQCAHSDATLPIPRIGVGRVLAPLFTLRFVCAAIVALYRLTYRVAFHILFIPDFAIQFTMCVQLCIAFHFRVLTV